MKTAVVIPALNEEACIAEVVRRCLENRHPDDEVRVVVCDNGSTDATAEIAQGAGAEVVEEPHRGYGAACLRALTHLGDWPDAVLFVDGDGSSLPEESERLLAPLRRGELDLVLGKRTAAPGSMTPQQRFGGWLATTLIALRWRVRYADLGPFRAATRPALDRMTLRDHTWGWTVEMQIRAIQEELRTREVQVTWAKRLAGHSKISGTLTGTLRAGVKIIATILRHAWR